MDTIKLSKRSKIVSFTTKLSNGEFVVNMKEPTTNTPPKMELYFGGNITCTRYFALRKDYDVENPEYVSFFNYNTENDGLRITLSGNTSYPVKDGQIKLTWVEDSNAEFSFYPEYFLAIKPGTSKQYKYYYTHDGPDHRKITCNWLFNEDGSQKTIHSNNSGGHWTLDVPSLEDLETLSAIPHLIFEYTVDWGYVCRDNDTGDSCTVCSPADTGDNCSNCTPTDTTDTCTNCTPTDTTDTCTNCTPHPTDSNDDCEGDDGDDGCECSVTDDGDDGCECSVTDDGDDGCECSVTDDGDDGCECSTGDDGDDCEGCDYTSIECFVNYNAYFYAWNDMAQDDIEFVVTLNGCYTVKHYGNSAYAYGDFLGVNSQYNCHETAHYVEV